MLSLRYSVQHVTNSRGEFTDLFDRIRKSTSRVAGHWPLAAVVALNKKVRQS